MLFDFVAVVTKKNRFFLMIFIRFQMMTTVKMKELSTE